MKGKSTFLYKTLVIGIIILFIGIGTKPVFANGISNTNLMIDSENSSHNKNTIQDINTLNNDDLRLPTSLPILSLILSFRNARGHFFQTIAFEIIDRSDNRIKCQLLYLRGMWLQITADFLLNFV